MRDWYPVDARRDRNDGDYMLTLECAGEDGYHEVMLHVVCAWPDEAYAPLTGDLTCKLRQDARDWVSEHGEVVNEAVCGFAMCCVCQCRRHMDALVNAHHSWPFGGLACEACNATLEREANESDDEHCPGGCSVCVPGAAQGRNVT